MTRDELFLGNMTDLRSKYSSGTAYDLLKSAAILRLLLLDDPTLLSLVKKGRSFNPRFVIVDSKPLPGVSAWFLGDGLDPSNFPHFLNTHVLKLTLDDFLKVILITEEGREISIRELIRYIAHIMGGVHAGTAEEQTDVVMKEIDEHWRLGDFNAPLYCIKPVIAVVLSTLEPLEDLVKLDTKQ